jgi:hypothetical protein
LNKLATVLIGGGASLAVVVFAIRFIYPLLIYFYEFGILLIQAGAPVTSPVLCIPQESVPSMCVKNSATYSRLLHGVTDLNYSPLPPIGVQTVSDLSVLESAFFISLQSVTGLGLGAWYGRYRRKLEDNPQSREELAQPWERAYETAAIGMNVRVITVQNREVSGQIQQMGSPEKDFDILLADPEELVRAERGDIVNTRSLGQFSYHHYRDISRVEFGVEATGTIFDPEGSTEGDTKFIDHLKRRLDAVRRVPPSAWRQKPSVDVDEEEVDMQPPDTDG